MIQFLAILVILTPMISATLGGAGGVEICGPVLVKVPSLNLVSEIADGRSFVTSVETIKVNQQPLVFNVDRSRSQSICAWPST